MKTTIAIDAGNTRIKWGVHDGAQWQDRGALLTSDAPHLMTVAEAWPDDAQVLVCNVAGEQIGEAISAALLRRYTQITWLRAQAQGGGVRNAYEQPEQLGADRWAALLGARAQSASACLVVCVGTATTVDVLLADGEFAGGLIVPGFDLMRAALTNNTAQLPLAEGQFQDFPQNTMDAIVSGCIQAQVGAIERMFAQIADEPGAHCLLSGGAAHWLVPHLRIPVRAAENLILDGLLCFAKIELAGREA